MVTTDINEVSDTPRTDAYARHWPSETECVPSSVARQLERELAVSLENQVKTQAEVERLTNALDQMTLDALATAKDRDEWMTKASMTIS